MRLPAASSWKWRHGMGSFLPGKTESVQLVTCSSSRRQISATGAALTPSPRQLSETLEPELMHRGAESSSGGIDIRRLHLEEVLTIRRQARQDGILFIFLFIYFSFLSPPPCQHCGHWAVCRHLLLCNPAGPIWSHSRGHYVSHDN